MCSIKRKTVLITGVNGFVGRALVQVLVDKKYSVVGMCRKLPEEADTSNISKYFNYQIYTDNNILSLSYWYRQLMGIDFVVHLAGRVHVMKEKCPDVRDEYMRINTEFTKAIIQGALKSGVRKFIYLSTIGVHGSFSRKIPVNESSPISVDSYYSESKLKAEKIIRDTCENTTMSFVILRPPLVYGANAKGNYLRLLMWAHSGFPFIFGKVNNIRSFINISNLNDIISTCINKHEADNQVFVVSDAEDISTNQLFVKICSSLNKKCISLRIPLSLLNLMAKCIGKTKAVDSLVGDYKIDISKLMTTIGWSPPYTLEDGIKDAGEWFKSL